MYKQQQPYGRKCGTVQTSRENDLVLVKQYSLFHSPEAPNRPPSNISWKTDASWVTVRWDPVTAMDNESAVLGYKVSDMSRTCTFIIYHVLCSLSLCVFACARVHVWCHTFACLIIFILINQLFVLCAFLLCQCKICHMTSHIDRERGVITVIKRHKQEQFYAGHITLGEQSRATGVHC